MAKKLPHGEDIDQGKLEFKIFQLKQLSYNFIVE